MPENKKLINFYRFSTVEEYEKAKTNIPENAIVFVTDINTIYLDGVSYGCNTAEIDKKIADSKLTWTLLYFYK